MYVQADRFLKLTHEIHNILTLNKLRALVLRVHMSHVTMIQSVTQTLSHLQLPSLSSH